MAFEEIAVDLAGVAGIMFGGDTKVDLVLDQQDAEAELCESLGDAA